MVEYFRDSFGFLSSKENNEEYIFKKYKFIEEEMKLLESKIDKFRETLDRVITSELYVTRARGRLISFQLKLQKIQNELLRIHAARGSGWHINFLNWDKYEKYNNILNERLKRLKYVLHDYLELFDESDEANVKIIYSNSSSVNTDQLQQNLELEKSRSCELALQVETLKAMLEEKNSELAEVNEKAESYIAVIKKQNQMIEQKNREIEKLAATSKYQEPEKSKHSYKVTSTVNEDKVEQKIIGSKQNFFQSANNVGPEQKNSTNIVPGGVSPSTL